MSWTEERIDRLKAMWTKGATASQIAEELGGVSRNAVIGKAHRLGLESRPSPVKAGEEKEKKAKAAPRPRPPSRPRRPAPSAARRTGRGRPGPLAVALAQRQSSVDAQTMQYRSVGPGGFIRQGPGDTQAPIPPLRLAGWFPAKPRPRLPTRRRCST
jgi:GcrA cell cycle regulator